MAEFKKIGKLLVVVPANDSARRMEKTSQIRVGGCVNILLTGYPAFESAVQAIHAEVDDYFVKPADLDSLISTIERKLHARHVGG